MHEMVMTFQFKATPVRVMGANLIQSFANTYGGLIGLFTQNNGDMIFNGHFVFFEIMFKANGFNTIFKIRPTEVNNQMLFADEVFKPGVKTFYEQLGMAKGVNEMALVADAFFLAYLKKQKRIDYKDSITLISNTILKNRGIINIGTLAYDANMSIRSFERRFVDQVGIPPKLFCNITRFNHALALKFKFPQHDWTSVALACGYFDQTHLIKHFKKFTGFTPLVFQKQSHLAKVEFTSQVDP